MALELDSPSKTQDATRLNVMSQSRCQITRRISNPRVTFPLPSYPTSQSRGINDNGITISRPKARSVDRLRQPSKAVVVVPSLQRSQRAFGELRMPKKNKCGLSISTCSQSSRLDAMQIPAPFAVDHARCLASHHRMARQERQICNPTAVGRVK